MSTLVSASVPTESFVLAETFERVPTVEFDALRLVGDGAQQRVPLLWARRADASADASVVRAALAADDTTASVEVVSRRDRDALFQVRWSGRPRLLTDVVLDGGGAVVSAHGTSDGWRLRLLFPDPDDVSPAYDACEGYGVSFDRIQALEEVPFERARLTDTQARTLQAALESGYYTVPRDVTISELASELDVSHQAVSERLRRAHRTLVETVLGV